MTMDIAITVALISLAGAAVGTFGGILTASRLSNYRIEQLEKKMDKNNSMMERFSLAERDIKDLKSDVDELKKDNHVEPISCCIDDRNRAGDGNPAGTGHDRCKP